MQPGVLSRFKNQNDTGHSGLKVARLLSTFLGDMQRSQGDMRWGSKLNYLFG